ncbi:hypothetical protein [Streptosporangium amethystogenes]|uniref:hypothetical protein n=1 Tax=Streptosporangium amethystogenes TaxID=2002 RepID=UPI0004CC4325|nr:hypothetical protein [Streptosporangium amethystogenes]
MTGTAGHACRACGNAAARAHVAEHLVAERDPARPVVDGEDIHAFRWHAPLQLCNAAGNVPARLILSRTHAYGIDLEAVGLPGPRKVGGHRPGGQRHRRQNAAQRHRDSRRGAGLRLHHPEAHGYDSGNSP